MIVDIAHSEVEVRPLESHARAVSSTTNDRAERRMMSRDRFPLSRMPVSFRSFP